MKNVVRKTKVIKVPFESHEHLHRMQWQQRSDKPYLDSFTERHRRYFNIGADANGLKSVHDGDFGGCNGRKENAWEEGRWTSWSVDEMKRILDKAVLPYKDSGETEVIDVYF